MINIYTIGFTKKTAEEFFHLIKNYSISLIIDVRLNNISQLAAFAKYPDIEFFLKEICNCEYKSDKLFAPEEKTLKDYKLNKISWTEYQDQFETIMENRKINEYIINNYDEHILNKKICFLCSESIPDFCHRRLIAEKFAKIFDDIKIIHLI